MKHVHGLMLALFLASPLATAQDLGALKGLAGESPGSSLLPGSAGNAAGILEFCIKNKYLSADAATTMKDKLLAKTGIPEPGNADDDGYGDGAKGLLTSPDGKTIDLSTGGDRLKEKMTEKACDSVLDHAGSLL